MGRQFRSALISTALAILLISSSALHPDVSRTDHRETTTTTGVARRLLGLGSSPPSCRSKCGRCLPCRPVHVPIQPGLSKPLEYYPEAWRCKCGNTLFMP